MQVEVLPTFRLPRNKSTFTYSVPDELVSSVCVGQLVEIPWRNVAQQGVITALHTTHVYKGPTKPIIRCLEGTPSICESSLDAVFRIARKYYTSPATLLSLFLPDIPVKVHKRQPKAARSIRLPELKVHTSAIHQIEAIIQANTNQIVKLQSEADRLLLYRQACAKLSSILLITPTLSEAEELVSYLGKSYPGRVILWNSQLGKNEQWRRWKKIKSSNTMIVIGTKNALFVPFSNIDRILLDQQGRTEHKQWEGSPYLDTRDIVREFASIKNVRLIETAFTPQLIEAEYTSSSEANLAPMNTIFRNNKRLITEQLEQKIVQARSGRKLVIVMPSLVQAGVYYCQECEHIWDCPNCQISLRAKNDELVCSICSYHEPIPTTCTNCRSYKITPVGVGLPGIKQKIQSDYGVSVGTFTASEHSITSQDAVILTTPYQIKQIIQSGVNVGDVFLFHPEQLLYSPDFKSSFQFYHFIHWHRLVCRIYTTGSYSIQTDLPTDHQLLKDCIGDQYHSFSERELTLRKKFQYPPYGEFIGISFGETEKTPAFPPEFIGPFRRKNKKKQWLLKQNLGAHTSLDKTLGSFYNKAKIDLNPDQITFIEFKNHA